MYFVKGSIIKSPKTSQIKDKHLLAEEVIDRLFSLKSSRLFWLTFSNPFNIGITICL